MNKCETNKDVLEKILNECGVYWALTVMAELVRTQPKRALGGRTDLAEKVARSIEKARDAT